ncbi:MAG TPA: universal stress protein [Solirubrobacter sp.]|nr:universal stress protein [Solirubrobacter sp.]
MTRVLIGYDGSEDANAAIAVAGDLFKGAETVVVTVYPPPPTMETGAMARVALPDAMIREGIERMRAEVEQRAHATVEEGVERARAAGLDAAPATITGLSAWRNLRDKAEELGSDVVVCGTRGEGRLERVVVGSTASSLLYHADRPMLIVPAGSVPGDGPIIAGYDDSDGARGALRFAAAHLAERRLVVTHAWRSPVRHTVRGRAIMHAGVDVLAEYADAVDTIYEESAQDVANEGAEFARELGLVADIAAPESGQGAWQTLLAEAREAGAAAILVGSRGRGAVTSTVLGSVASGLVHAAALPVIVVPGSAPR